MFVKFTAILASLAVAAQVVVAAPPACVLAAVNTESDPSNFKAVCHSDKAQSYMTDHCGSNLEAAQSYFMDICKSNGNEVTLSSDTTSSASESSTGTATASSGTHSATSTDAAVTGSNTYGGAASGTGTRTASASTAAATGAAKGAATGAASCVGLGMDVVGMGALLALGAMLAL